jgi:pimeloyl-ACP methyl ester carboxylesterase/heme-degrading monooxygenase HmoA
MFSLSAFSQNESIGEYLKPFDRITLASRIPSLTLSILHVPPANARRPIPVLFIHGASFPSALSFAFRMNGYSWMDDMSVHGYDTYALDFLGYGQSSRYPEMSGPNTGDPVSWSGTHVARDIDLAVDHIRKISGSEKIYLIGHSWGATVCAYYATQHPEKIERLVLFAPFTQRDGTDTSIVNHLYEELTPDERVQQFIDATDGKEIRLEAEIFDQWKREWLQSDTSVTRRESSSVRFPAGWEVDFMNCMNHRCYYNPADITVPVLLIRGEWDGLPSSEDAVGLYNELANAPCKRYIVISRGTHVMHLEKSRFQLYSEVRNFIGENQKKESPMIAVIFEVWPNPDYREDYLTIAASLKNKLQKIDGFISIERFESLTQPGKILSLSFWKNEDAVRLWRNTEMHRRAQTQGIDYIFKNYRLRVAGMIRDYGMFDRDQAPTDSKLHLDEKR